MTKAFFLPSAKGRGKYPPPFPASICIVAYFILFFCFLIFCFSFAFQVYFSISFYYLSSPFNTFF